MKKVVNGITYLRDPLFAKIEKRHKEWLVSVEASIFYETPLADLGVTEKRIDILCDMGLVFFDNQSGGRNIYSITEKGEKILAGMEKQKTC